MASTMALENPSLREGKTKISGCGEMFAEIGDPAKELKVIGKVQVVNKGLEFLEVGGLE